MLQTCRSRPQPHRQARVRNADASLAARSAGSSRAAPLLVVALAGAALAIWLYCTSLRGQLGSSTPRTVILDSPAFTFADVQRIAREGGEPGNPMCAQEIRQIERQQTLRPDDPGDILIDVGFFTTRMERSHTVSFGWPSTWYSQQQSARYADQVKREGFRPWHTKADAPMLDADMFLPGADYMSPQPRWSWNQYQR